MSVSPSQTVSRCTLLALAASGGAAACGLMGLTGWALSVERLVSIVPGYITMKPNTALALMGSGLAVAILSARRRRGAMDLVATAISLLVAVFGVLTLGEYAFGWNPGFDHWLFRDLPPIGDSLRVDRMSPATAFCLVLAGSSTSLYARKMTWDLRLPMVAALAVTLGGVASLALAGYAAAALLYSHWWDYAGMAIHSAAAFGLLATGLLALLQRQGALVWALDRATTAGFILAAVVLLIANGLSYSFTSRLLQSAGWVDRSQEVLKVIERVSSGLAALESGQRGFLITGDPRLLEPRQATSAGVTNDLAALRRLTDDNSRQRRRLNSLEPLIPRRMAFGERTIQVRRQQGREAASDLLATGTGIALSARMSSLLEAMQAAEYVLLKERQSASSTVSAATFLLLPLGVFLSLTILSAGLFFLNAGVRLRARVERALQESEQRIAGIVGSAMDAIVSVDPWRNIILFNQAAERMFRIPAADALGQSLDRLIPGRFAENASYGEIFEGVSAAAALKGLRADGEEFPIEASIARVEVAGQKIDTVILRDGTERQRADEASALLAAIVESSSDAIVGKDLRGDVTSWNRGAERMFGYAASEMIGQSITVLIPPSRLEDEEQILTRIRRGERVEHFETVRSRKDGSLLEVSVTVSPIKDALGKIIGASKVARDITDRRNTEVALRESERLLHVTDRRLAEIMQGMTEACFALDAEWCFTFINDRCQTLFSHSREEVLGRPIWDVFPHLLGTPVEARYRRVMRERAPAAFEASSPVDERWLDIRLFPTAEGLAAFLLDIHARKLGEVALRDSQARLSSALSAGLIGTWTWDLATDLLSADEFTAGMFSLEVDAAAKGLPSAAYLVAVLEADRPAVAAGLAAAIESCGQYDLEYRVRHIPGELRWLQARGRVECNAAGHAENFHGAVLDITERKQADVTLREAEKEKQLAFEASRLKSEFLANMSHELRTPLNCILGFTEFLIDEKPGALNPKQKEYLTDVYNSSRHLLQLINDVLDLAKVEAGKIELIPAEFPLGKAMEEVCAVVKGIAQKKNLHVALHVPIDLDCVTLDQQKFKQICYNLLSNAVKFTEAGGSVQIRARALTAGRFEVQVADTGLGIRPEDIKRLFREFEQLDSGAARRFEGTGLGLALTRKLVEAHGGTISAQSTYGEGSTFTFTMPVILNAEPSR